MTAVTPHPSATVVLMRDGAGDIEILMVQRSAGLSFHGGAWVFPGGRIDEDDIARARQSDAKGDDPMEAARHAAVREAREEAGIAVEARSLVPFAEWVTPEILPKRFRTWFFAARAGDAKSVRVDGGEVVKYSWVTPDAALSGHRSGTLDLPHPTWVTLTSLRAHRTVDAALAALAQAEFGVFRPRLSPIDGGTLSLFEEDVAYDSGDVDAPGPRHRLYAANNDWRYERR
jgi:8-oxo-dGTP pyrophosphatase MutT (NUDIX family)